VAFLNSRDSLLHRRENGTLTWRGPAIMLFARSAFALLAQGIFAAIFALNGSPQPWRESQAWLPVYGTLIDAGCLALLWRLTRLERIRPFDLIGFERARLGRDVLLGLALIPLSLLFIAAGTYPAGWFVYGTFEPPLLLGDLPLAASLYGVLVWPFVWGITEQMTYNGYLLPRFQVLCRSTVAAVAIVAFVWSLQHAFMPMTFDAKFMLFRLLAPIPHSIFGTLVYLRIRRLLPLAIAHALMDGATVLIPLLRS
jgi:membrane protease YdiL (CAAX protease family)